MTYFIKKIGTVVMTLLMITSIGSIYGDCNKSPDCGANENCYPCPPVPCGRGFISGDLLYWRAFESGLDTCVPDSFSDTVNSDGIVVSRFSGTSHDPHFAWNLGFRVGAMYEYPCSDWNIGASWTHFYSHAHEEDDESELHWDIDLDVIDIISGYEFDLRPCFSIRTFIGIRGAKIDQEVHINEFDPITIDNDNKEKFLGIGPLIGLEAEWDIGCGFSFYTNVSTSWLYGNYDVKFLEFDASEEAINYCEVRKHLDASLAAADAGFGVRWESCICRNLQLLFQLGLEHHRYFDYNRIGECGDLSFDGVNFSFGINF